MIILWTDALIFLLIAVMLLLGFYLRGKEYIKRPMQQIARSKTGMMSLTVLIFFVVVGLLDSIHFKPQEGHGNEIISALDYWATPLREHGEKTYSAPFAVYLYSKEMMTLPDGTEQWGYPRLQFGGAHLADPETEHLPDILEKAFYGWLQGAGLVVFFMVLLVSLLRESHKRFIVSPTAKAVWAMVFLVVSVNYMLVYLSAYYHVFGTDKVGEDVFYQAIKSIRTGLVIGTLTTLVMLPMALVFGIMAGFFRGWVDDVIQYIYTTLNSIPSVLLIAASILMVQVYMAAHEEKFTSVIVRADMRLLFLCLILGVTSWTGLCRLLRAETLKLREMEYVQAAQAMGVRRRVILLRHILPNVMHIVLISVVLDFSSLVLAEAVLSYINIGVDPTTYSWGNMINGARLEMAREPVVWWSLTASFIFMFALVLAANLFADTVRDAFDPRRGAYE
ncbi:MAG: ABC transporter permease [Methylobacter sp.]|uniref:ABC transporter permease n=1 Tax=Methylobacter sp. TaxID=2051955 RepID=UPI00258B6320|nr:ABC transporter permease [Methylobacter sp.]MCL7422547.1 ABC transporter permease [Methylobacter sp.]